MNSKLSAGITYSIFQAIIVAITAISINYYAADTNNFQIILFQNLVSLIIVGLFEPKLVLKLPRTKRYRLHVIRALFGIGIYIFHYNALKLISPLAAVLLLHTAPIFVPIMEWFYYRRAPKFQILWAILFGFLGLALVLNPKLHDFNKLAGILSGLMSGICLAVTFPITKSLRSTDSIPKIIFLYSFHSIILSLGFLISTDAWQIGKLTLWFYLVIGLLYFLQVFFINKSISYIGSIKSSIATNLTVIFVIIFNYFLGNSVPGIVTLIGIFIVIISSIVVLKSEDKRKLQKL